MFKRFAAAAVLLTMAGLVHARPFTAKDLALLDRVSDPQISPDGRYVAYSLRSTDWEANRGFNALWVIDRNGPNSPRLVRDQEKSGLSPRWSADGQWLYFLSGRSGSTQVWRTPADGGEGFQVTKLPLDVGLYRLTPDGRSLVMAILVYPDCDSLTCSKGKEEAKAKDKATGTVYESATPRFWDSYLDGRYMGLFAARLGGDTPPTDAVALTRNHRADIVERPDGDDSSFVIGADGNTVIFSARPSGSAQGLGDPSSLYSVPLDGSRAPQRINADANTSDSAPAVSPDGTRLAYLAETGSTFTAPRPQLMIRELKTGATRALADHFDRSANSLRWSADSKTLYTVAQDIGQARIFAINATTGTVRALTGDGHVSSFDLARNVMVYSRDALDSPAQIYELIAGGSPRQLTHADHETLVRTPLSAFEAFSFSGWNDETVHGYLVKPADFRPEQKYPVAFLIHGGPHGSFGNAWSYRWNPQVWAAMGYAVVMVDFHGSSGYGEAFAKSIIGHWGDRPLTDLQKGWSYALSRYGFLDADRACALGGSYGGYMVAWIAGNWNKPWKCLVDHDGVFDIRLMSYSTDIPGYEQAQNDAPTWERPESIERFNPIDHLVDWTVPILVVHSGRDDRVPLDQGMGAYGAAQLRHVPSQLLYFPDENHWVLKPQNSVQWYATVEAWMKRWLGS
jgi:dipeptidyl aminopeptidase/acylaminoacyl peptidase